MAVTTDGKSAIGFRVDHQKLDDDLRQLLKIVDNLLSLHALGTYSPEYETMYSATLKSGIESLLGTTAVPKNQAWDDAMAYGREVITAPEDSEDRASSFWTRSCSVLHKELLKRFGAETIQAAQDGTSSIITNAYGGERLDIAHVNKKASYLRHRHDASVGAGFYPESSPLAATCYQSSSLCCSLAMSAFLPVEKAVQAAYISHLSVCDDVGSFTEEDYDVRMRMIAISAGVAHKFGGKALNVFVDGTAKQAVGAVVGELHPIEAAMAWRAVSGCSTIYSQYNFDDCDIDVGLVAPIVMMAIHDLLDWRCDLAAGNHENAVSAVHGFGVQEPFHAFLETMLKETLVHPRSGLYGIASVVYMHFTVGRYGAWEYHGNHKPACRHCVTLLRTATQMAGLQWKPLPPPKSYDEGNDARERGKAWSDHFKDTELVQETLGWFQYLISTGEIWIFDVLAPGASQVDADVDWA